MKLFQEAIDKLMPKSRVKRRDDELDTVEEIVMNQRMQNLGQSAEELMKSKAKTPIPPELLRK